MTSFAYQYAIGTVIFVVGLVYAGRQGYVGLSGRGLRNLLIMLGGLLFFMALQGYLQFAPMTERAPATGPAEVTLEEGHLGQPIDFAIMGIYLVMILLVGTYFGRRQKTTKDFFFGGQRFAWWLIASSLVATLVGSYSFVKYSQAAYSYGLASSQSYLNDWAWMPLLVFGWIPILYFSRVSSVPEYLGRRFNSTVRFWATLSVLIYLVSYVGVNLFTMGSVLEQLLGWPVLGAAIVVASVSAIYVTFGGQTSVIMTDLFQGLMLLLTGLLLLALGIHHLGGFDGFWENLPRGHRQAFNNFNENQSFPSVGIFWQDAMANSAFFYFINQGILMRFMATKSMNEARKAALALPLLLMPVAACVVASGGWIAQSLVNAGVLEEMKPKRAFYVAAEFLSRPGIFGLILAALTAALMSTVDTLITAVSSVFVNDLYRPYLRPQASDRDLLRVARICAVSVTLLGIALVPIFAQFDTIYAAHGAMTAAVTPPLVVTLLLAVFWRRFTATAALCTIVGGLAAIALSVFFPGMVAPFAHGVPAVDVGDGLFAGLKQYKFMRACFGLSVSLAIAVTVTLFTRPESEERQRGLVWGTIRDAIRHYKGSPGSDRDPVTATAQPVLDPEERELRGEALLPVIDLSASLAANLETHEDDLLYVSDARRWLGGLNSTHAIVGAIRDADGDQVFIGPRTYPLVVRGNRENEPVRIERLY